LRDVWAVVKRSAVHRLGRPLLLAYLALAMLGLAVVAVFIVAMRIGPQ
jgi:hypothetical protein